MRTYRLNVFSPFFLSIFGMGCAALMFVVIVMGPNVVDAKTVQSNTQVPSSGTSSAGGLAAFSFAIGSGVSAATGGRLVPALFLSAGMGAYEATMFATGVRTPLYYHSSYLATGLWRRNVGRFLWGPLRLGVGLGGYYAVRGYRETTSSELQVADDFTAGPAFRVVWHFLGPAFISVDGFYGLVHLPYQAILLSTQDATHLAIGIEL